MTNTPQFKEGDIVRLRAGSPALTVETPDGETVGVVWFVGGELRRDRLHVDAIEKVTGDKPLLMCWPPNSEWSDWAGKPYSVLGQ